MSAFYDRLRAYLETHKTEREAVALLNELKLQLPRSVRIVHPYDLRANQQTKYADTVKNTRDWTAFVNRTGTLVHVMRDGAPHILIRMPGMRLGGTAVQWMVTRVKELLYEGLS